MLKPDEESSPYVLVQMVHPSELGKYIPKMEIESATRFGLKRFYFRFQSAPDTARGMRPESYLQTLGEGDLGKDVVIDLGGEMIDDVRRDWESAFNKEFIRRYIYIPNC